MATTYTAQEAAAEIGITDSRIRQICINSHRACADGLIKTPIGKDHAGRWLLNERDIRRIRQLRRKAGRA